MRRLRLAAATDGDRSHRTGTRRRNIRSRCKHHFARERSRLLCARLSRLDTLRDSLLPRNACKHRIGRPSETDPDRLTNWTGDLISFRAVLFEEHHVSPRRCAKMSGVVIRISRPNEAVIRYLVPFFARYFASLAADANTRVCKKSNFNVIAHVGVLPLIRTLSAFANHRLSIFPSKP